MLFKYDDCLNDALIKMIILMLTSIVAFSNPNDSMPHELVSFMRMQLHMSIIKMHTPIKIKPDFYAFLGRRGLKLSLPQAIMQTR